MRQPLVTRVRLGVSHRAHRYAPLGRQVVLKLLPAEMSGHLSVERCSREIASALAYENDGGWCTGTLSRIPCSCRAAA